jgi:hypothetical protein
VLFLAWAGDSRCKRRAAVSAGPQGLWRVTSRPEQIPD